jgi:hypothetical protein
MISFFPLKQETRLVTIPEGQLFKNLEKFIKPVKPDETADLRGEYLFNGIWNKENFSISLILKISNNFVPIISGNVLSSDEGTLVKLKYEMFPATKKLLMFWTIITLLITLFFIGIYQAWLYGAISFGFCVVNYILSREHFKIQTRKSRRMIEKLFSYTEDIT